MACGGAGPEETSTMTRLDVVQLVEAAIEADDVDALRAAGLDAVGVVAVLFLHARKIYLNGMGKACLEGAVSIVSWLVECGEDTGCVSIDGGSALHFACAGRHLELANWLVAQGTSVNVTNKLGMQPLHDACVAGHLEVAQWLLSQGADVNAPATGSWQPLHMACAYGHLEVVQWLVGQGADVNANVEYGYLPVNLATNAGKTPILQWLLEKCGVPHSPAYLSSAHRSSTLKAKARLMLQSAAQAHTREWAVCLTDLVHRGQVGAATVAMQRASHWWAADVAAVQALVAAAKGKAAASSVVRQGSFPDRGMACSDKAMAALGRWVKWNLVRGVAVLHRARLRGAKRAAAGGGD